MNKLHITLAGLVGAALVAPLSAQGRYVNLGRGTATSVSDDGRVVAGTDFNGPYRWTEAGGFTALGRGNSESISAMSGDGNIIVGNSSFTGQQEAAYWNSMIGWNTLGGLPGSGGCGSMSSGMGVNRDGTVIVGLGWEGCEGRAFLWTPATGMMQLQNHGRDARANCVSGDGLVVGGWDSDPTTGQWRAAAWYSDSRGQVLLLPPTPNNPSGAGEIHDINSDGTVLVGRGVGMQGSYAFRYVEGQGAMELGLGRAYATNDDGTLIGGQTGQFLPLPGGQPAGAFLWTPEDGLLSVESYLANQGITPTTQTPITSVRSISPNGKYLVGQHGSFLSLNDEGYLVELPDGVRYGIDAASANTLDLSGEGSSQLGQTFVAKTSNLTLGAAWTLIGVDSAKLPFMNGMLLVNVAGPLMVLPAQVVSGEGRANIRIPNNARLEGGSLFLQTIAPDMVQPAGVAFSNGMKITIRS